MEKYLVVITTILVITQIIRIIQNAISLHKQNQLIKAQLDELGGVTNSDMKRKIIIDKMLVELLPKILLEYNEDDTE